MEAALRTLLEESFGEFVAGGLTVDASRFPLTLRDLQCNEKRIQEAVEEEGGCSPFELTKGSIGSISVNPGWMGVEICATDIVLNFSFNAVKAVQWAMRAAEADGDGKDQESGKDSRQAVPRNPRAAVAPRYCSAHGSSEQRAKIEHRFEACKSCGARLQTNYADFSFCPPCSNTLQRCMLCSAHAPSAGSCVPAHDLRPLEVRVPPLPSPGQPPVQPRAPMFCSAHDASEKRSKSGPRQRECTECHRRMQTNYTDFALCPACSIGMERCMICGAGVSLPRNRTASAPAFEAPRDESIGRRLPSTLSIGRRSASTMSIGGRPASAANVATGGELLPDRRSDGGGGCRHGQANDVAEEHCALTARGDMDREGHGHPRLLPRGGWRDSSRSQPEPVDCGLQCNEVSPGSEGPDSIMGFLKMFDVAGVLQHCSASPRGGRCSASPGGGDGAAPALATTCVARPPPPLPPRKSCSMGGDIVADPPRKLAPWRVAGA